MAVIVMKKLEAIPVRFNLWVMLFTGCWVAYMLRVNISLNLIAMVPENSTEVATKENDNSTIKEETTSHKAEFDWTENEQALILGSYFWMYPVTSLVGGMAAERWGPRYVVLITTATSAFFTVLSPVAARWHYKVLIVARFFLGAAGGFIYPALHVLIARWVPPAEKGRFISAMMGGTLGTVVTWSLTGPLIKNCGWPSAFYIPALMTFIWCFVWWYLIADSPNEHPRISESEKKYIQEALGNKVNNTKKLPPFKGILTSLPFFAMMVLHFGNLWGLYFIMTVGPKFVASVLGFKLSTAGVISALPYLARLIFSVLFGYIGDFIVANKLMRTVVIRKFFTLFSHIIPGLLLVVMVYCSTSTAVSVTLITLSMGSNGAATLTNLMNHQDLAPNFAGTLYGIANFIGSTAGFFTPMITAYYTSEGNSIDNWRPVFFIGASVYMISAIIFIIFGSADTQPWNFVQDDISSATGKPKDEELNDVKKEATVKE